MKTIWKYKLSCEDEQIIKFPGLLAGDPIKCVNPVDQILSVGTQNNEIIMWVMVDTESQEEEVNISVRGTGWPCEVDHNTFIGTCKLHNDLLVFHVFAR